MTDPTESLPPALRMGTDPVSKMLCSLGYQVIDEVLKFSNPKSFQDVHYITVE